MKISTLLLALTTSIALFTAGFAQAAEAKAAKDAKKEAKPKLRHVVAFKFKEGTSKDQILKVEQAFAELPKKITTIKKFEWGTNNSPENRNKGCTHGFILTFKTEKDRDNYLVHPAHKEFGALVGPLLDDVFVIDYWQKK